MSRRRIRAWFNESERHRVKGVDTLPMSLPWTECPINTRHLLNYICSHDFCHGTCTFCVRIKDNNIKVKLTLRYKIIRQEVFSMCEWQFTVSSVTFNLQGKCPWISKTHKSVVFGRSKRP